MPRGGTSACDLQTAEATAESLMKLTSYIYTLLCVVDSLAFEQRKTAEKHGDDTCMYMRERGDRVSIACAGDSTEWTK